MKKAVVPIRFAASQLGEARHVGGFLHRKEEEYRVLLPFSMLQENSCFVPPGEILGELRERRARQTTAHSITV